MCTRKFLFNILWINFKIALRLSPNVTSVAKNAISSVQNLDGLNRLPELKA